MPTITGTRETLTDFQVHCWGLNYPRRRELQQLETLVAAWLLPKDSWRYRAGLPVLDDMLRVITRLPQIGNSVTLETHFDDHRNFEVGLPKFSPDTWEQGDTLEEAVFNLLLALLPQVCPQCHVWDGHDRSCGERDHAVDAESAMLEQAGL